MQSSIKPCVSACDRMHWTLPDNTCFILDRSEVKRVEVTKSDNGTVTITCRGPSGITSLALDILNVADIRSLDSVPDTSGFNLQSAWREVVLMMHNDYYDKLQDIHDYISQLLREPAVLVPAPLNGSGWDQARYPAPPGSGTAGIGWDQARYPAPPGSGTAGIGWGQARYEAGWTPEQIAREHGFSVGRHPLPPDGPPTLWPGTAGP
jgi:hypothetical protein